MRLRARLLLAATATSAVLVAGFLHWQHRQRDARQDEALKAFATAAMEAGGRARCEADPARFVIHAPGPRTPPPRPVPPRAGPGPRGPFPPHPPHPPDLAPAGGPDGRPRPPPRPGPPPPLPHPPPAPAPPAPTPGSDDGTWLFAYDADLVSANPSAPPLPTTLAAAIRAGAATASGVHEVGARRGRELAWRTPWGEGPCAVVLVRRVFPEDDDGRSTLLLGALALVAGVLAAVWLAAGHAVVRLRRLAAHVGGAKAAPTGARAVVGGHDEVSRVAEAFDRAGAALAGQVETVEARARTLRAFVANTTHDVATPLTVLAGHLASLRDDARAGRPADAARVGHALEEVHYVGHLLHNLSAQARLEAGEVHLAGGPVDLAQVVRRAVDRHLPLAAARGVALEHAVPDAAEGGARVTGDLTLLEQAVSNLVHNAVSYADGRVAVVLEVAAAAAGAPGDRAFCLRVLDDGPGASPDELPHLADRGYRGHAGRTRRPGGGGLGLAIVKDVVTRHGFSLHLAAASPHGLEVTVRGPVAPPPRAVGG